MGNRFCGNLVSGFMNPLSSEWYARNTAGKPSGKVTCGVGGRDLRIRYMCQERGLVTQFLVWKWLVFLATSA